MFVPKPIVAVGASCILVMGAAALAQTGGAAPQPDNQAVQTLVLDELARVDWINKSKVSALREGVIESMELQIGMPVKKGGVIGYLHREIAELTVKKNALQAKQVAPEEKAKAGREVAASVVARNNRLNAKKAGMVSDEDAAKAEGELKVADAQCLEARENRAIAEAELALAERALAEHTMVAPFDGIVLERKKQRGESVRANEWVITLGDTSKLCAETYAPLEYAFRIKEGQVVEIQPQVIQPQTEEEPGSPDTDRPAGKSREDNEAAPSRSSSPSKSSKGKSKKAWRAEPLPIEKKRFRGKITYVSPEIQPVAETAVRVRAEFDNPGDLRPGLMVRMTIFLTPDVAAAGSDGAAPTRTARAR